MRTLQILFWSCLVLALLPFLILYLLSGILITIPVWLIEFFQSEQERRMQRWGY